MEELPFSAGLQIIAADQISKGIDLIYVTDAIIPDFDSRSLIDKAFQKSNGKSKNQRNDEKASSSA